jgi:hypothetical protein
MPVTRKLAALITGSLSRIDPQESGVEAKAERIVEDVEAEFEVRRRRDDGA